MTQIFNFSNELTFELCCCSSGIQSSKMMNCCTSSRIAIKLHKYQACYFLKKFFASQVQSFLQTNFILYYFDQAIKQYNLSILLQYCTLSQILNHSMTFKRQPPKKTLQFFLTFTGRPLNQHNQNCLEIHLDGPFGAPASNIFRAEHAVLVSIQF